MDAKSCLLKYYEEDYAKIDRITGGLVKANAILLFLIVIITPVSFFVFDNSVIPIFIIGLSVFTNTAGVASTFLSQSLKKKIENIRAKDYV